MTTSKRVLVLSPRFPYPPRNGSHHRTLQTVEFLLRSGFEVHVVFPTETWEGVSDLTQVPRFVTPWTYQLSKWERRVDAAWNRIAGRPVQHSPIVKRKLSSLIRRIDPVLIWANYSNSVEWLPAALAQSIVVDIHDFMPLSDVLSRKARSLLRRDLSVFASLPDALRVFLDAPELLVAVRRELEILKRVELIVNISTGEGVQLAALLPKIRSVTFHYYKEDQSEGLSMDGAVVGLMPIGEGENPHNLLGARCLDMEMRGRVTSANTVVASGAAAAKLNLGEWCQCAGHVEDYEQFVRSFAFGVCPAFWGTGAQVKQYEFAALGIPIVAYADVVDPEIWVNRENCILVSNPGEFADAIVGLCSDVGLLAKLRSCARELPAILRARQSQEEEGLRRLIDDLTGAAGC